MNHKIFTDGREFYVFKGLLALPVLFVFLLAGCVTTKKLPNSRET